MRSVVRRYVWATLLAGGALLGCSSSSGAPAAAPPPIIDPTIKGLEILGNGTDVFGLYAVEENVKGRVLDVAALNAAQLLVYSPDVQEYRYEETSGHTMSQYIGQRSASLGLTGNYKFFSAEVKTTFTSDTYRRDDYSYASIIERHWKHAVKVSPGVWASGSTLRPYLSPLAREAIDDADPTHGPWSGAQVLAAYGTHVMTGIYVGARLDYHLAIQIMDESNRTSLSAFVKAKYGNSFASAGVQADISQETYNAMNAYQKVGPVINAKGGASQYAHPEDDAQYVLWKASLETNPVFCGIVSGGLLPIWELASTPQRRQEILSAFEAYAATQDASFAPLVERITDIRVVNAGAGLSVTLPPGYDLLRSANGDTTNSSVNNGIASDLVWADNVYLAYKAEATEDPRGLAGVHVTSTDPAADAYFFGGVPHDAVYDPGACTTASDVDLNAGTCGDATVSRYTAWCVVSWLYGYHAACYAPGTPLFLHVEPETPVNPPIRCLVIGDEYAVNVNLPMATRAEHIYFGPRDANHDGKVDAADATWVLEHTYWLTNGTDGDLVNLNFGVQSYHRWDWWSCYDAYDDAWIHDRNAPEDAQHIGVCFP